jgi:hypothetical protein
MLNKFKQYLLFTVVFMLTANAVAQNKLNKGGASTAHAAQRSIGFPASFSGRWKGKLLWMVSGKPAQEVGMQLIVLPADTAGHFTWQIIYGDNGKDNRPYLLKPIDTASGHWVVDERNGIVLDSYVHGNALHGAFTVQGNTIVDNYKVMGNAMEVEFFSIRQNDKRTSGNGTDDSPTVDSYRISSYQTGKLIKQ